MAVDTGLCLRVPDRMVRIALFLSGTYFWFEFFGDGHARMDRDARDFLLPWR